jgi:hypothetical protein
MRRASAIIDKLDELVDCADTQETDEVKIKSADEHGSTYHALRANTARIVPAGVWGYINRCVERRGVDSTLRIPDSVDEYTFTYVDEEGNSVADVCEMVAQIDTIEKIMGTADDAIISINDDATPFYAFDIRRYLAFLYRSWQMMCITLAAGTIDKRIFSMSFDIEIDANFRLVYALENKYPTAEMYRAAQVLSGKIFYKTMESKWIMPHVMHDVTVCYPADLYQYLPNNIVTMAIGYVIRYSMESFDDTKNTVHWVPFFIDLIDKYYDFITFLWASKKFGKYAERITRPPETYRSVYEKLKAYGSSHDLKSFLMNEVRDTITMLGHLDTRKEASSSSKKKQ